MDWACNTIWYEQLSNGEFHHVMFDEKEKSWTANDKGSYFIIDDYKPKSKTFNELNGLVNPKFIEFNKSTVTSFSGISRLKGIKRLEMHYCRKLETDQGLIDLSDDLEWLHINNCRKFIFSDDLLSLKKLKVLCLNDCAEIENLDFLSNFPELLDFRFVGTNIKDGNLQPLFDHPSLVNVGFINKNHYNVKESESDGFFDQRSERSKEYIYKDENMTFKYKNFD